MKKKAIKKIISLLLILVVMNCSVNCFKVGAESNFPTITYDGDVKIISNIPTEYFQSEQKKRTRSTAIDNFLKEIGYTESQIMKLSEEDIAEYISAEKIYSVTKKNTNNGSRAIAIDPLIAKERDKFEGVFSVLQYAQKINGKTAFRLKTTIDWTERPFWRLKDIIAMAWTPQALSAGSIRSDYRMTYDEAIYADGNLLEFNNDVNAISLCEEADYFPCYAVEYDIPTDILTSIMYSDFHLEAETVVTAEEDFIACSGYGHQTIAGNPSVSVDTDNTAGIGLDFNYVMDDLYFGTIRVWFSA